MKKLLFIALFTLVLTACSSSNSDNLNHIKTELEGIGYVFEQRDEDSIAYYNDKTVNEALDIDVTLIDLYIGYVNETEGWLELLVFDNESQAETYVGASTDSGYIVYREGNVVFITYSSDAMAPFIENSSKQG